MWETTTVEVQELYRAVAEAEQYLCRPEMAARARAYLADRGVEIGGLDATVGYAPPAWRNLIASMRGRFSDDVLVAAGLAKRSARGAPYDTFRNRVLFPIRDVHGRTIGFIGRDLSGNEDTPRYLCTPTTPLFRKSTQLYSPQPRQQSAGTPVLVEGPIDALAIVARTTREHCALFPVSALGTVLSTDQISQLQVPAGARAEVVIALDGDRAGRKAALAQGEALHAAALTPRIAVLPNGLDPAEYLAIPGNDVSAFTYSNALPLLALQVQAAIAEQGNDMQWVEGRARASRTIATKLSAYGPSYALSQTSWIADVLPSPVTFSWPTSPRHSPSAAGCRRRPPARATCCGGPSKPWTPTRHRWTSSPLPDRWPDSRGGRFDHRRESSRRGDPPGGRRNCAGERRARPAARRLRPTPRRNRCASTHAV